MSSIAHRRSGPALERGKEARRVRMGKKQQRSDINSWLFFPVTWEMLGTRRHNKNSGRVAVGQTDGRILR